MHLLILNPIKYLKLVKLEKNQFYHSKIDFWNEKPDKTLTNKHLSSYMIVSSAFFKQLKDHKFYFRTFMCIFPTVGMMKTVEWLSNLGSTVSSIDDSWSEVREFESHWDSDEVTLFLPAAYHRYGDSRWWIVPINKSYSLPDLYWSKLGENIIKYFIFLLSFINWNQVKFVYENSKSHKKQIFYIFDLTSSKSSITIWYLRKNLLIQSHQILWNICNE